MAVDYFLVGYILKLALEFTIFGQPSYLDKLQTILCTTTCVPSSRVLGIVFLTFVICWAPFFIINLVVGTCGQPCDPPAFLGEMALWLGKLNCSI